MLDEYMTEEAVIRLLGLADEERSPEQARNALRWLVRSQHLPVARLGRRIRLFRAEDVRRFIEAGFK